MLSDIGSVGFKVENFNRENMGIFEGKWADIKEALILTAQLVASFGLNSQNLSAHNSILPVAYYLYMKNPGESYLTQSRFDQDRRDVREWLIRSLLKSGVWGSGLDTLLTVLRDALKQSSIDSFPMMRLREEMARRGRALVFDDEELEQLADMQYDDRLTFALLSLLFPHVDLVNQFHIDHIFPAARFARGQLGAAGVPDEEIPEFRDRMNRLANLQLLQGHLNHEKSATMPAKWLSRTYPSSTSKQEYKNLHLLGEVPEAMAGFGEFYEARRARLKEKIRALLGRDPQASATSSEAMVETSIGDDDE